MHRYRFASSVAPKDPPCPQDGKNGKGWLLPWVIIVALSAIAIPCGHAWTKMETTTSFSAFTPRTADCTKAFSDLNNLFGPGTLFAVRSPHAAAPGCRRCVLLHAAASCCRRCFMLIHAAASRYGYCLQADVHVCGSIFFSLYVVYCEPSSPFTMPMSSRYRSTF